MGFKNLQKNQRVKQIWHVRWWLSQHVEARVATAVPSLGGEVQVSTDGTAVNIGIRVIKTRWWFQIFFIFTNTWEWFPFWLIFSKGLKPPTRRCGSILIIKPSTYWSLHSLYRRTMSYSMTVCSCGVKRFIINFVRLIMSVCCHIVR